LYAERTVDDFARYAMQLGAHQTLSMRDGAV
jgi:hypothetical protein